MTAHLNTASDPRRLGCPQVGLNMGIRHAGVIFKIRVLQGNSILSTLREYNRRVRLIYCLRPVHSLRHDDATRWSVRIRKEGMERLLKRRKLRESLELCAENKAHLSHVGM